jgi:hypothetical protein
MDDVLNRFAKELADAIGAAAAASPEVEACQARVREAGFDMRITLEAIVDFVNRHRAGASSGITAPPTVKPHPDLNESDLRFLRSLRIAADEVTQPLD